MSGANPNRLCFLDTNIWLYAFIPAQSAAKAATAKQVIQQSDIIISSQIINEVCVNPFSP